MYKLPTLPYDYEALGKNISAETLKFHHDKHHQTYVDKLNLALAANPDLNGKTLEEILAGSKTNPDLVNSAICNNGGGHYNHSLYWQSMSPNGGGEPTGELAKLIIQKHGSFQTFVDEFTTKAFGVFGSGWVWLQPNGDIITTANQDMPTMFGLDEPLLGLDVWEHAYYIDYRNKRDEYVKSWWNIVNWDNAAERYSVISKKM